MRLAAPDRRKRILDAAMKLFSEQGFDGTSTRQIAEAAEINEALIFRHFKTKEDLYWSVLEDRIERRGRNRRIRQALESGGGTRDVLVSIAEALLDRTADDAAVTRLLFYSALRNPELSDRFFQTYAHQKFELLAEFIERKIFDGELRAVEPMVAARSFMGMIIYHYLVQELFGGGRLKSLEPRELAEEVVDLFLGGTVAVKARAGSNGRTGHRRKLVALSK